MSNEEFCSKLQERTTWVYNDLKAFLYIRLHALQHKDDNIGGGNISTATVLFVTLGLLAKVNYFVEKPEKFDIKLAKLTRRQHSFVSRKN
jgi:hypothetical protein